MNKKRQNDQNNQIASLQRQARIRKKVYNVTTRPRLSVFRSNRYVFAQIIDRSGNAVIGVSERALEKEKDKTHSTGSGSSTPIDRAKKLGTLLAKKAIEKKIKEVVFDKGRFAYHGRVKAIAEGAREGGLQF